MFLAQRPVFHSQRQGCFIPKGRAENAVDIDTGVILAAEITPGNLADSASVVETRDVAIATVIDVTGEDRVREAVADQGDDKLQTLSDGVDHDLATTFSEPGVHGERRWHDKPDSHKTAFDDNHDRVTSVEGKALPRRSGRTHLRSPVRDGRQSPRDGARDGRRAGWTR